VKSTDLPISSYFKQAPVLFTFHSSFLSLAIKQVWCRWTTSHFNFNSQHAWFICICKIWVLICTVKVQ